ncbi:MAG: carboxypeptidase-like regulatory domain-containing protein, partial [Candidatus Cloacimonetes bacterium]|nr:carboxypeptidase-like regulatory domain-containing protein [Candidatus Cloacimonadota bacterium]
MGSRSPVPISSIYLNKLNINTAKWELIQSTYNSSQDFIEAALTDPQGAYLLLSTFAKPTPTPEPTPTSTPSITPTPTPIPAHTLIPTPTFTTTPTQTPVPSLTLTPTRTPAPIPRITGFIFDAESAKPVNGAAVQIDNGALQSFSNAKGQYFIYDVPAGAHKLQMWGFAYEFKEKNIIVPANGVLDMGNETL